MGYGPRAGVRLPHRHADRKGVRPAGRPPQAERDLHLRRIQVRHVEHPRHLRARQQGGDRRPGLSGLQRHERDDRPLRSGRRARVTTRGSSTFRSPRRTASSPTSRRRRPHRLPVLPNNPTGTVATKAQLKGWVDYALANDAVIFFDAAYEAFITEPGYLRSIYEIEGAKRCAVEFRKLSKTAGFTGAVR